MSEFTCDCCGRFRRDGWAATRAAMLHALEGEGVPTLAQLWRAAAILAAETGVVHRIEWWHGHGFSIDGRPMDAWFEERVLRDAEREEAETAKRAASLVPRMTLTFMGKVIT